MLYHKQLTVDLEDSLSIINCLKIDEKVHFNLAKKSSYLIYNGHLSPWKKADYIDP